MSGAPNTPLIEVGQFQDGREQSYGADWLGAIQGGFAIPLKILRTEKAMGRVGEEAFADGLRARGVYAGPGQGKYSIEGTITRLDCSELYDLEAHAHVDVQVTDAASHVLLYRQSYRVDQTEGGVGAGIFGSRETLRTLTENALRELVDNVLDDSQLRQALQKQVAP